MTGYLQRQMVGDVAALIDRSGALFPDVDPSTVALWLLAMRAGRMTEVFTREVLGKVPARIARSPVFRSMPRWEIASSAVMYGRLSGSGSDHHATATSTGAFDATAHPANRLGRTSPTRRRCARRYAAESRLEYEARLSNGDPRHADRPADTTLADAASLCSPIGPTSPRLLWRRSSGSVRRFRGRCGATALPTGAPRSTRQLWRRWRLLPVGLAGPGG
jgi:hypothetical protein